MDFQLSNKAEEGVGICIQVTAMGELREGPIIQIGASLGSTFGQFIRMATWQRITLVAAGAGAGIAATFNATTIL